MGNESENMSDRLSCHCWSPATCSEEEPRRIRQPWGESVGKRFFDTSTRTMSGDYQDGKGRVLCAHTQRDTERRQKERTSKARARKRESEHRSSTNRMPLSFDFLLPSHPSPIAHTRWWWWWPSVYVCMSLTSPRIPLFFKPTHCQCSVGSRIVVNYLCMYVCVSPFSLSLFGRPLSLDAQTPEEYS